MGSEGNGFTVASAPILAAFVSVLVILGGLVAMVTVILPVSTPSCEVGAGSSGARAPGGLSGLARELWDVPLHLQVGQWYPAGATMYYANDSTGSGHFGSIPDPAQANLDEHPDTFAELSLQAMNEANRCAGCFTFADANALGVLPYMTALRVARSGHSIVVYKRDIGYGQGPEEHTSQGFEYRIDLWGPAAQALGVSKDQVDIELAPKTGAAGVLEATPGSSLAGGEQPEEGGGQCEGQAALEGPLPLTAAQSAQVLPDGLAAAPESAPSAVDAMIAAGNRLYGSAYLFGGAHGQPLSAVAPAYDCSSAVSFVLHAGGVFGLYAQDSTELESYGLPGPGRYVTIYANSQHAFMYVAGLRFDTSYAGTDVGPNENKSGPRWRVLDHVPDWAPWVVRHPAGL